MQARIEDDGAVLALTGPDGAMRFHAIWLRDNALDFATRDARNGQRLITLADLPADTRLAEARIAGAEVLCTFAPNGHSAAFPLDWLRAHRYDLPRGPGLLPEGTETWDASLASVPAADQVAMENDAAPLRGWLDAAARLGFAKVTGVEPEPGALFSIVNLFGYVRETNYGRLFDVRSEVDPVNLAYTGFGLQAHTDNPYRDPVPTLQFLACIENSARGGDSMVVDGFAAALRLRDENPAQFDLLTRYPARFEYSGSHGVHLAACHPIIELGATGALRQIRFNARSAAPVTDVPFDILPDWYAACRAFSDIVDDPAMAVRFKLNPGEAFLVDNTRVLHARTGFSGAGTRWLQGCYADKDGLLSTLAALTKEQTP